LIDFPDSKTYPPIAAALPDRAAMPQTFAEIMRPSFLYFVTAFLLGFVWLFVLSFAPGPALVLRGGTEEIYSLPRYVIWALFPFVSLLIAISFKGWIIGCRGWKMLLPALALPWIGTAVISLVCGIAAYSLHRHPNGGFLGAFWYGVIFTLMGFWVVFPMGLLSQWLLTLPYPSSPREENL
jgi:hypothetical protein